MSYPLLWIEALTCVLLWTALAAAWAGRIHRRWARGALRAALLMIPSSLLGLFVVLAADLRFFQNLENNWFLYSASLLLGTLVGMAVILHLARRREPGLAPAAREWPWVPLMVTWLAAAAVLGMSYWNIDIAVRARIDLMALQAETRWEMERPALVSDDQNAAPLYKRALDSLREDSPDTVQNPPLGNNETFDPKEPATIAYLARHTQTIALLRQAGALPVLRLPQDMEDPNISAILAEQTAYGNAANVLTLDARYELSRGRSALAMADAMAIFGLARHVGQRPLFVSALLAIGIDAKANYLLPEVLPAVTSAADLAGFNVNAPPSGGRSFYAGIESDKCFGLDQFRDGALARLPAFMLADEVDAYRELLDSLAEAALEPYYKSRQRMAQIVNDYGPNHRHNGIMAGIISQSMARSMVVAAKLDAGDECGQVAVAMTRYRLDHGALPDHLEALVPEYLDAIPLDPFDGKPLRLVARGGKWIIYSVGPDEKDDGGIESHKDKGDLIFTLRQPIPATGP